MDDLKQAVLLLRRFFGEIDWALEIDFKVTIEVSKEGAAKFNSILVKQLEAAEDFISYPDPEWKTRPYNFSKVVIPGLGEVEVRVNK